MRDSILAELLKIEGMLLDDRMTVAAGLANLPSTRCPAD
jgi:hypothetical protein